MFFYFSFKERRVRLLTYTATLLHTLRLTHFTADTVGLYACAGRAGFRCEYGGKLCCCDRETVH